MDASILSNNKNQENPSIKMRKVIATQHFFEFPDLNSEIDGIYFVSNRQQKTRCFASGLLQLYSPCGEFYCFAVLLACASDIGFASFRGEYNITSAKQKYH